ncbi:MAG TPA: hypothetical protein EYP69_06010 [Bacteroidales bacterium]|nr:hypothetical protein [Bacteroidales bacterium]
MNFPIKIYILLLFFFCAQKSKAQLWKRTRYEAIIVSGASVGFTDLGGANAPGTHFVKDLDFQTIRPLIGVAARYKYQENIAFKYNMIFGYLKAGDYLTTEPSRERRGVIARTPLFEVSFQGEYSLVKERLGRRYSFAHFRGGRNFNILFVNTYIFAGFGGIFFSPQVASNPNGKWVKPDGQAPSSKGDQYSHISMTFPFGLGFKYAINRKWKIGLEFGNRYTLTDYLDNHSDIYSKGNDSYFFLDINLIKRLRTARSGLPKF